MDPDGFDVTDGEYFKQNNGERKLLGRVQRLPGGNYRAWQFEGEGKGFVLLGLFGDFQTALSKIELSQPLTSKIPKKRKRQPRTRKSVQPNRV
jgi:hypothetical protein